MTQPGATIQSTEEDTSDSSASRKYLITFSFAIIAFVFVV
jgi:hypothetical protein